MRLFILIAFSTGCGPLDYQQEFSSRSPKRPAEIRVLRNFPGSAADYFFRVEISEAGQSQVILKHEIDSSLGLIQAHWSLEGDRVGLLVCEMLGSGPIWSAYDFGQHTKLAPDAFRPDIEKEIRNKYSLRPADDVIAWACSHDGRKAYRVMADSH